MDGMQTRGAETQACAHDCTPRTHRRASTTLDSHARTSTRTNACTHARTQALLVHTRETIRACTHPARARNARTRLHAHNHARARAHSCARTHAHTQPPWSDRTVQHLVLVDRKLHCVREHACRREGHESLHAHPLASLRRYPTSSCPHSLPVAIRSGKFKLARARPVERAGAACSPKQQCAGWLAWHGTGLPKHAAVPCRV